MLFGFLVEKGVLSGNPALDVKPPPFSAREETTRALSPAQVRTLLDSIDTGTVVGLRDRALIGLMLYPVAEIWEEKTPPLFRSMPHKQMSSARLFEPNALDMIKRRARRPVYQTGSEIMSAEQPVL